MLPTLYALSVEHRALAERLADMDLDEQTIADTLDAESGALEAKARSVAAVVRSLDMLDEGMAKVADDLAARRKAVQGRRERLRAYLRESMQRAGMTRITSPEMSIALRDNPESVDVFDAAQVPALYMADPPAPPPKPDKAAIKRALQDGFDVPGCRLTRTQRVEIK